MSMNFDDKLGKYICIHCGKEFFKIPLPSKGNECPMAYEHFIVKKSQLKRIKVERRKR